MRNAPLLAIRGACAIAIATSICRAQAPVGGIGVALESLGNEIQIAKVLSDTPAERAGLKDGMVIRRIDGFPTLGKTISECVDRIRGLPGTKVFLEVLSPGQDRSVTIEVTREWIRRQ